MLHIACYCTSCTATFGQARMTRRCWAQVVEGAGKSPDDMAHLVWTDATTTRCTCVPWLASHSVERCLRGNCIQQTLHAERHDLEAFEQSCCAHASFGTSTQADARLAAHSMCIHRLICARVAIWKHRTCTCAGSSSPRRALETAGIALPTSQLREPWFFSAWPPIWAMTQSGCAALGMGARTTPPTFPAQSWMMMRKLATKPALRRWV